MNGADRREHPIEAISAFIDDELRGSELEAVESHLAGCESCRRLAEDLRRLAQAVPDAARSEVPAGLEARIKSRLRDEPQATRHRKFVLPVAIAATVGALALLTTVQLRQSKPLFEPEPRATLESPREEPVVDENTAAKKQSEADAGVVNERSNRAAGTREQDAVSVHEQEALQKADARDSLAKDRLVQPVMPAAPPPATAAPKPNRDGEQSAALPADKAERQDADKQFAPPPPPPGSPELKRGQLDRGRPAASEDARRAKEKSSTAESEVDFVPGGVVGGVVGGVAGGLNDGPANDVAPPCPSPWRAPVEVSWDTARSGDPQSVLATVARDHAGQVISGRDERGPFVSLLLPATAWPGIFENLRTLGAIVPAPPPPLPAGTLCVRLDVRTQESLRP